MGQHFDGSSADTTGYQGMPPIIMPPYKVLIVDDEPDIVEEVVEQLEDDGLTCLSAFNAQTAMDLVRTDPEIGVIVTDIRMPGMEIGRAHV